MNQNFITAASFPFAVAVDGAHVYWTNRNSSTIGRANLDGTGANENFVTGVYNPTGTCRRRADASAREATAEIPGHDEAFPQQDQVSYYRPCAAAVGCGELRLHGVVSIQIKHATRTVSRRRVALRPNCTFGESALIANSRLRGRGANRVLVSFPGNARLKSASASRKAP